MTKKDDAVRLPNDTSRTSIIGRTGSGKTFAGVWHLSQQNFDVMPWILLDFKGDPLLAQVAALQGAVTITLDDPVPTYPGLYIMRVLPNEKDALNTWLWKVWDTGYCGIYVDEGYMLSDSDAFDAILTQGRSKHIPVIILSQRPVWLNRFVFSESNFFQVFHLNDRRDRRTVREFVPANLDARLEEYNSYYYDVGRDKLVKFQPVPDEASILASILAKLPKSDDRRPRFRAL